MARVPGVMTPVLEDPETANELEMASQARGIERDKNELPWKDNLVIYTSVKSKLELCDLYSGRKT